MLRSSSSKYAIVGALAAAICGFLHSLPFFQALPSGASLAAATRGIASFRGLEGYGTASWADVLAGRLWQSGGASRLAAGEWLAVFAGSTVAALLALAVVIGFLRLLNDSRTRTIVFGSIIALTLATGVPPLWDTMAHREDRISDLGLRVPLELASRVRESKEARLFANPSALESLLLLTPARAGSVSMSDSVRLSANPERWREAYRREKWDAVLLSGPLGEYRPLLKHLLISPDWHLAAITNHGFLFLRGFGLPVESVDETFHRANDRDTAVYLGQISAHYDALGRTRDARECVERALALAPDNATVLSHAATFAAAHKRWQNALDYSRKALTKNPELAHAKIVQALALVETGEADRAQELVDQVLLDSPDDSYTLFLSARICRTLRDYAREAESLEKLVAIGQKTGGPTANYRIYLGQAYARQRLAEPALQNYRAALASGQLDARQAEEIRHVIESIESGAAP